MYGASELGCPGVQLTRNEKKLIESASIWRRGRRAENFRQGNADTQAHTYLAISDPYTYIHIATSHTVQFLKMSDRNRNDFVQ